jgi:uncharacterized membrane protein HdeD (DUF308 family)
VLGIAICLVGAVWLGQGTNVIHGSFMSGQALWAVIGGAMLVVGAALLVSAWRARE